METETTNSDTTLALVGEITAPFGVRGQVKMRPLMDKPETLSTLPRGVTLRYPDNRRPDEMRRVLRVQKHGEVVLLTFDGLEDRNAIEYLRGALVLVGHDELPPLDADTYYARDLVGLLVITDTGRELGAITDVHFSPANDVYETPVAMIPAVGEIVLAVDITGGRVTVRDIPGLRKDE